MIELMRWMASLDFAVMPRFDAFSMPAVIMVGVVRIKVHQNHEKAYLLFF
ncbi:MAG: hypothetical protein PUC44_05220 [Eubacteriales bacterium]|nr:hypothetical protein [Eubacteriales bacterium]